MKRPARGGVATTGSLTVAALKRGSVTRLSHAAQSSGSVRLLSYAAQSRGSVIRISHPDQSGCSVTRLRVGLLACRMFLSRDREGAVLLWSRHISAEDGH
jgi:hypothetical protein